MKPVKDGLFFTFVDDSTSAKFVNTTATGILIAETAGDQANIPRWGIVQAVGPDVTEISVGEAIYIEPGMWTASFETLEGERLWKTDVSKVLVVSDEPGTAY